jgi:hypothetical protein
MPKLILEFNIPEERDEAKIAQNGGLYYSMLFDIRMYLRSLNKYDERDTIPKEELIDKISSILEDFEE